MESLDCGEVLYQQRMRAVLQLPLRHPRLVMPFYPTQNTDLQDGRLKHASPNALLTSDVNVQAAGRQWRALPDVRRRASELVLHIFQVHGRSVAEAGGVESEHCPRKCDLGTD
jgi:hypothetical protein